MKVVAVETIVSPIQPKVCIARLQLVRAVEESSLSWVEDPIDRTWSTLSRPGHQR